MIQKLEFILDLLQVNETSNTMAVKSAQKILKKLSNLR